MDYSYGRTCPTINGTPVLNTSWALKTHGHLIKWRPDGLDKLVDIGCGNGDVLVDVIVPSIPSPSTTTVFGTDISKEVIEICSKKYEATKNLKFVEMDVLDVDKFCIAHGEMDHVMSIYTLHWIQDQERCFRKIFKLLKAGGDFFSLILAKHASFEICDIVMRKDKWAPYLSNVKNFFSPYYKSAEPEKQLQSIMEAVGFEDVLIELRPDIRTADVDGFKSFIKRGQPEIDKIPQNQLNDYLEDYLQCGLEHELLGLDENTGIVSMSSTLLFAFGRKKDVENP